MSDTSVIDTPTNQNNDSMEDFKKGLKEDIKIKLQDYPNKDELLNSCIKDLKENRELMKKINPSTLSNIGTGFSNFFTRKNKVAPLPGGKKRRRRNKTVKRTKSRR